MLIPEHSRALITAAHHEEVVKKLKEEIKTAKDEARQVRIAHYRDMAYMAKLIRKLQTHGIDIDEETIPTAA